jgi:hypothetical protein
MADNTDVKRKESGKPGATSLRVWVLLGLTALFFLVALFAIALVVMRSFQNREISLARSVSSATPEASQANPPNTPLEASALPTPENSPAPENSPLATALASPTPSETSSASPESSSQEPSPSSTLDLSLASRESTDSGTEIPVPSPASQATPPPVVANSQEEDLTRKEVLRRIDMLRELTPKEKDFLYSQVERARGFTKLAIVPYGSGQLWPDSFQTKYLLENLSKPEIAKIFEDPTVVLVLVGFSDLKGSDERNLEISRSRSENLVKLLHRRTKIINLMRAVGMGGSDIFDKMHLEKNRVVEMWIVRP